MRNLLLLVVFILGSSCQAVLKTAYGVRRPTLKQKSDIRAFVHDNGCDSSKLVYFKSFESFTLASKKNLLKFPEAYFFDPEGNFVSYNKTAKECNAGVDLFLHDLRSFDQYAVDTTRTEAEFRDLLRVEMNDSRGITVYITFATYIGKLNDDRTFEWVRLMEKARRDGVDINYYLVNCDFLKEWNIPEKMQRDLGIKS